MTSRRPIRNYNNMRSLNNDFDAEVVVAATDTATPGRYSSGQIISTNNKLLPLEIASDEDDNDDDGGSPGNDSFDTKLSLTEKYQQEKQQSKVRHWKTSEYAAGLVEPTWEDELEKYNREGRSGCSCCCPPQFQEEIDPGCGCVYLSAVVCSRLGADRIGNMAVLKSRDVMVEVDGDNDGDDEEEEDFVNDDEEEALQHRSNKIENDDAKNNNSKKKKKKDQSKKRYVRKREIQFIVGPFWPMLLGITYPLIFGVSTLTIFIGLPGRVWYIQVGWTVLTVLLIRALFNTGFRDPGILARHKDPPKKSEDEEEEDDIPRRRIGFRWGTEGGPWTWSEQAQSYRPRNASYDPDCAVVVEEFDHT